MAASGLPETAPLAQADVIIQSVTNHKNEKMHICGLIDRRYVHLFFKLLLTERIRVNIVLYLFSAVYDHSPLHLRSPLPTGMVMSKCL